MQSKNDVAPNNNLSGGVVGPGGRIIYDGKRMRKAITRRTVDHCASIMQFMEDRLSAARPLISLPYSALQPNPSHIINLLPPFAYADDPVNAATTKFIHLSLNKQRCPINAVRWTPDGRRLLTGTSTGEFTLWNGTTFNFETILQAHETAIRAMSWSHNGNFLITGDHAGTMKVWQPSMNNLQILNGHKEPVRQVTFSPNDSKFASCSDDGNVKIWDFASMAEERTLSGHGWDVKSIHWHPFKSLLASGSKDNLIKLWDPRSGNNVATIHGHKNAILDIKWNRNGNWLLSSSKESLVKLFDIRTLKEMQTFRSHKKEVNAVAWHPFHEGLFATAGAEGAIYFHLTNTEEPVGTLEGAHDNIIWSLDWHPLGHMLTSGSADCSVRFWTRHRPGDTLKDKFILGKNAADALGITEPNMQTAEDEEELPGLGMAPDRRPNHGRRENYHQQYQNANSIPLPQSLARSPPNQSYPPMMPVSVGHGLPVGFPPGMPPPPPGWRPPSNFDPRRMPPPRGYPPMHLAASIPGGDMMHYQPGMRAPPPPPGFPHMPPGGHVGHGMLPPGASSGMRPPPNYPHDRGDPRQRNGRYSRK